MRRILTTCIIIILFLNIKAQEFDIKPLGIEKSRPNTHSYFFRIVDSNNKAINETYDTYLIMDGEKVAKDTSFFLDNNRFQCIIQATPLLYGIMTYSYTTSLSYKIEKEGFYTSKGSLTLTSSSNDLVSPSKSEAVILYKPEDYLEKSFLNSSRGKKLKNKIIAFIDLIRIQSLISNCDVAFGQIKIAQFKNNPYLTFKINSLNVYNEIKLNRYDIGKEIFDVVIRKLLNPLNDYMNDNSFYGYDITVITQSKNFVHDNSISKITEYRFLLPRSSVIRYKNKDISGQNLLNDSIILMDDERIDLKLQ